MKPAFLLLAIICSNAVWAQKQLTDAEVQGFFALIRQTNEYKTLRRTTDSINNANPNHAPQQVDVYIVKRDEGPTDDNIFSAALERTVLGTPLERYILGYDRNKKQLVFIKKQQTHFRIGG